MSVTIAAQAVIAADQLDDADRAYLVGELDTVLGHVRLMRIGAVDMHGRLTPFGVLLARHVAVDQEAVTWTEADSIALTARLVCDGARMRLRNADERRAAVSALARRGMSAQRIAERIGGTDRGVTKLAREAGTPVTRPAVRGFRYADIPKVLAATRGAALSWEES